MKDAENAKRIIASRLAIARKQAGLSQSQVAKLLELPRPSISEIEAARRRVAADELVRFADLYQVEVNWLVGQDSEEVDQVRDKFQLAARGVANLKKDDLEKVIELLTSLKAGDND